MDITNESWTSSHTNSTLWIGQGWTTKGIHSFSEHFLVYASRQLNRVQLLKRKTNIFLRAFNFGIAFVNGENSQN